MSGMNLVNAYDSLRNELQLYIDNERKSMHVYVDNNEMDKLNVLLYRVRQLAQFEKELDKFACIINEIRGKVEPVIAPTDTDFDIENIWDAATGFPVGYKEFEEIPINSDCDVTYKELRGMLFNGERILFRSGIDMQVWFSDYLCRRKPEIITKWIEDKTTITARVKTGAIATFVREIPDGYEKQYRRVGNSNCFVYTNESMARKIIFCRCIMQYAGIDESSVILLFDANTERKRKSKTV